MVGEVFGPETKDILGPVFGNWIWKD